MTAFLSSFTRNVMGHRLCFSHVLTPLDRDEDGFLYFLYASENTFGEFEVAE